MGMVLFSSSGFALCVPCFHMTGDNGSKVGVVRITEVETALEWLIRELLLNRLGWLI